MIVRKKEILRRALALWRRLSIAGIVLDLMSIRAACHDRPTAKTISQALEQAGIRPSQPRRKVGDYVLDQILGEGPGYQDWQATHVQLADVKRRVRL